VTSIDLRDLGGPTARPLLLVTVGTDHHPFDRLVGWVDGWLADGGGEKVNCVMQYGTAAPPLHAVGERFMDHDLLQSLMRAATIVVVQGGPIALLEARKLGLIPISVPRRAHLGEVVDNHQAAFCRHMQATGDTVVADDEAALRRHLDEALASPTSVRSAPVDFRMRTQQSIARFAEEADALLASRAVARQTRHHFVLRRRPERPRQRS
jgi:UDP-N-acetylglucosamine transferase subunit ALG13